MCVAGFDSSFNDCNVKIRRTQPSTGVLEARITSPKSLLFGPFRVSSKEHVKEWLHIKKLFFFPFCLI